jgi:hypothetical protein
MNTSRVIMLAVGFLIVFGCAYVEGADWRSLGVFGPYAYYYDSESVRAESNGINVWVKYVVISEESRNWVLQNRNKKGLATKGYESYAQSLALWVIDCSNSKWGVLKGNDYDTGGRLLASVPYSKTVHWLDIMPTSSADVLRRSVCR